MVLQFYFPGGEDVQAEFTEEGWLALCCLWLFAVF